MINRLGKHNYMSNRQKKGGVLGTARPEISQYSNSFIKKIIKQGIDRLIEEELAKATAAFLKKLEKRKTEFIAGLNTEIMQKINVETFGHGSVHIVQEKNKK